MTDLWDRLCRFFDPPEVDPHLRTAAEEEVRQFDARLRLVAAKAQLSAARRDETMRGGSE